MKENNRSSSKLDSPLLQGLFSYIPSAENLVNWGKNAYKKNIIGTNFFYKCNLSYLDLSKFTTSKKTLRHTEFTDTNLSGCYSSKKIDVYGMQFDNVKTDNLNALAFEFAVIENYINNKDTTDRIIIFLRNNNHNIICDLSKLINANSKIFSSNILEKYIIKYYISSLMALNKKYLTEQNLKLLFNDKEEFKNKIDEYYKKFQEIKQRKESGFSFYYPIPNLISQQDYDYIYKKFIEKTKSIISPIQFNAELNKYLKIIFPNDEKKQLRVENRLIVHFNNLESIYNSALDKPQNYQYAWVKDKNSFLYAINLSFIDLSRLNLVNSKIIYCNLSNTGFYRLTDITNCVIDKSCILQNTNFLLAYTKEEKGNKFISCDFFKNNELENHRVIYNYQHVMNYIQSVTSQIKIEENLPNKILKFLCILIATAKYRLEKIEKQNLINLYDDKINDKTCQGDIYNQRLFAEFIINGINEKLEEKNITPHQKYCYEQMLFYANNSDIFIYLAEYFHKSKDDLKIKIESALSPKYFQTIIESKIFQFTGHNVKFNYNELDKPIPISPRSKLFIENIKNNDKEYTQSINS